MIRQKYRSSKVLLTAYCLLLTTFLGCGMTSRVYLNPETDIGYMKRVAILPFENLSTEKYAGEKVTQSFLAEMLIAGDFAIVEPGEVNKALQSAQATGGIGAEGALSLDIAKLQKLTSMLNCQGVIIGTLTSYQMVRVGTEQYPEISLNVRLVDGKTGTIVWMSTLTKRGGPGVPFIGYGEQYTLNELTQVVCKDMVQAISKNVKKLT